MHHLREDRGAEIDLLVDAADRLLLVEAKSGATVVPDALDALDAVARRLAPTLDGRRVQTRLVYGGAGSHARSAVDVVGWSDVQEVGWR